MDLGNHIATNLISKGLLYSLPLTDGILLHNVQYEIITHNLSTRRTGSGDYNKFIKEVNQTEDITAIKVYIDWWKKLDRNSRINVELLENDIKKKIYADIIVEKKKDIKIELKTAYLPVHN